MLDSVLDDAKEYDQNLMKINYNTIASPLCINRQNKVYWTIKPEGNYTELDPELWRNGGGLFHPNCRHYIVAYFEGESDPVVEDVKSFEQNEIDYNLQQELNYIKRNKNKWYKRKEVARLTNSPHQAYETKKWKEWVARQNNFIAIHGEMRV
jgi:hypothetical protein